MKTSVFNFSQRETFAGNKIESAKITTKFITRTMRVRIKEFLLAMFFCLFFASIIVGGIISSIVYVVLGENPFLISMASFGVLGIILGVISGLWEKSSCKIIRGIEDIPTNNKN